MNVIINAFGINVNNSLKKKEKAKSIFPQLIRRRALVGSGTLNRRMDDNNGGHPLILWER